MATQYTKGTVVRLATTAKVGGQTLTDPTNIRIQVFDLPSSGGVASLIDETQPGATGGGNITRSATGTYFCDVDTSLYPPGTIHYRWTGTGTAAGSAENLFIVT